MNNKASRSRSIVASIGIAAALAALVASATACTAPVDTDEDEDGSADFAEDMEEPTDEAQQAYIWLGPGFYTTPQTGNKVLAVWSNYYCWVLDPGEFEAISIRNNWPKNMLSADLSTIAVDRPGSANQYCPWPNGMLVRDNAVYLIDNGKSCHIVSNEQVAHHGGWQYVWWPNLPSNQVKFEMATEYTGDCTW